MNPENNPKDNIINLFNSLSDSSDTLEICPEIKAAEKTERVPPAKKNKLNKKKIVSFLKNENSNMAKNIIDDQKLFNSLTNKYKLILSELLAHDKISGQEYISRILDATDDELTLAMVKNKVIYNFLNRNNKIKIIEKLIKSPWLPKEETKMILEIINKSDSNTLNHLPLAVEQGSNFSEI